MGIEQTVLWDRAGVRAKLLRSPLYWRTPKDGLNGSILFEEFFQLGGRFVAQRLM